MRLFRRRGIALVLTLMVATLLIMLAGAFIGVNRTNVRLLASADLHQKALEAAQSGVEYARMRMERCVDWGVPGRYDPAVTNNTPNTSQFTVWEVIEGSDANNPSYKVIGIINGGEAHFQILFRRFDRDAICEYDLSGLDGFYTDESIEQYPNLGPPGWTAATCTRNNISINYLGGLVSDPPLRVENFDPSGNPTGANATNRTLATRDCRVVVLGYCKGISRKIEAGFGQDPVTDSSIASGQDLAVAAVGNWTISSAEDDNNQVRSNGKFYAREGKIQFGDGYTANAGTARAKDSIHINSSVTAAYNATTDSVTIQNAGSALTQAEMIANGTAAKGEFLVGGTGASGLPVTADAVEKVGSFSSNHTIPAGIYTFVDYNKVEYRATPTSSPVEYTNKIQDGTVDAVYIKDGKFIVPNDSRVVVNGNIEIKSDTNFKPTVGIGYNAGGGLSYGASAVLTVKGDLTVNNGTVVGSGSVVAAGDGTSDSGHLKIAGRSNMQADPDVGITTFSQQSTEITAPVPGYFKDIDFAAFKDSMSGFNNGQWQGAKKLNQWSNLNFSEKMDIAGKVDPAVVNDTQVTAATPTLSGDIRTTDVTVTVGNLDEPGSVLNTLVSKYEAVTTAGNVDSEAVMANVTALVDLYQNGGTQNIGGVDMTIPPADKGISVGRYLRLREFLQQNEDYLNSNGTGVSPNSLAWANVTDPNTSQAVGYKVINQMDYYNRVRDDGDSMQDFFAQTSFSTVNATDANFSGLLFSNKNIFADLGGGNFFIDGAMIANNTMAITNANNVSTRYNPTYIKPLINVLYGNNGTRLVVNYWVTP